MIDNKKKILLSAAIVAAVLIPAGLWLKKVNSNSETYAYQETRVVTDGQPASEYVKKDKKEKKSEIEETTPSPTPSPTATPTPTAAAATTQPSGSASTTYTQPASSSDDTAYKRVTVSSPETTNNAVSSYNNASSDNGGSSTTVDSHPESNQTNTQTVSEPSIAESYDEDGQKVYIVMYDPKTGISESDIAKLLENAGVDSNSDIEITDVENTPKKTSQEPTNSKSAVSTLKDTVKNITEKIGGSSNSGSAGSGSVKEDLQKTQSGPEQESNQSQTVITESKPDESHVHVSEVTLKLAGALKNGSADLSIWAFGVPQNYMESFTWHIATISGSPSLTEGEEPGCATLVCGESDECEVYADVTLLDGTALRTNTKYIRITNDGQKMFDSNYVSDMDKLRALDSQPVSEN